MEFRFILLCLVAQRWMVVFSENENGDAEKQIFLCYQREIWNALFSGKLNLFFLKHCLFLEMDMEN